MIKNNFIGNDIIWLRVKVTTCQSGNFNNYNCN